MISNSFLSRFAWIGTSLSLIGAVAAFSLFGAFWSVALFLGWGWALVNFYFFHKLLRAGFAAQSPEKSRRLMLLMFLKFPIVYLAGYFVLRAGLYPTGGIIAGLTVFFVALAIAWVRRGSDSVLKAPAALTALVLASAFWAAPAFAASGNDHGHEAHGHAATAHADAAHDQHHGEAGHDEHHEGGAHLVNWVTLLAKATAPSAFSAFLYKWEKAIFAGLIVLLLTWFALAVSRSVKMVPTRLQAFAEILVSGVDGIVTAVLGPAGRKYTPFLGSLFIYIFFSNMFGLLPLQNSATGFITTTVPLAVSVFFYVQWAGIRSNGLAGYLHHMAGSPKDIVGWLTAPLMFPLHVLGEFIKPLSLSFRLYGNIMAGHVLMAVFLGMGLDMLKSAKVPIGVPIHFPFLFLEIAVGLIQAFVFTLLSTIYISMMLPHDHEHEDHRSEHPKPNGGHAAGAAHH